ncbi:nucleic-acid-binding protein from transposon X-element, partial [Trichonephila clavipes]
EKIKFLYEKFPNIRNKTSGDVIKIYTNDFEEYRSLIQAMVADKEFELYVINPKLDKPIKVVIKGLPISSKIEDIKNDLEEEGYVIESCTQLISKRTTNPLPFFQVILPRNDSNKRIFALTHLYYLQVKVEGYLVRGINQCFNCNNFFHTSENCHLKPRCLKTAKNTPRKTAKSKKGKKTLFVLTARSTVTRHVIQNVPNSLSQRKVPLLLTQSETKISPVTEIERKLPWLILLVEKPQIKPLSITRKKKIALVDSLVKRIMPPT